MLINMCVDPVKLTRVDPMNLTRIPEEVLPTRMSTSGHESYKGRSCKMFEHLSYFCSLLNSLVAP
jgi:hypothetical protein